MTDDEFDEKLEILEALGMAAKHLGAQADLCSPMDVHTVKTWRNAASVLRALANGKDGVG